MIKLAKTKKIESGWSQAFSAYQSEHGFYLCYLTPLKNMNSDLLSQLATNDSGLELSSSDQSSSFALEAFTSLGPANARADIVVMHDQSKVPRFAAIQCFDRAGASAAGIQDGSRAACLLTWEVFMQRLDQVEAKPQETIDMVTHYPTHSLLGECLSHLVFPAIKFIVAILFFSVGYTPSWSESYKTDFLILLYLMIDLPYTTSGFFARPFLNLLTKFQPEVQSINNAPTVFRRPLNLPNRIHIANNIHELMYPREIRILGLEDCLRIPPVPYLFVSFLAIVLLSIMSEDLKRDSNVSGIIFGVLGSIAALTSLLAYREVRDEEFNQVDAETVPVRVASSMVEEAHQTKSLVEAIPRSL